MPPSEDAVFAAVRAMNKLAGLDLSVGEGRQFCDLVDAAGKALAAGASLASLTPEALQDHAETAA